MAGSVNKVILIGNLGADPEVRAANDGRKIVNIRLAVSESWKAKDGERKQRTEGVTCCIFNENLGKIAEAYLRKGSRVYIEGKLQTRKWTAKDGSERYSTEVVLQGFDGALVLLDGKQDAGQADDGQSYAQAKGRESKPYKPQTVPDDAVPF